MPFAAAICLLLIGTVSAGICDGIWGVKLEVRTKASWKFLVVLFAATLLTLFVVNNHKFIPYNNYSYLTEALLHSRLDTPDLPPYLESIELGGKIYMHFAPGVSFALIPLGILIGPLKINYAYVGITLGALNAVLFYKILEELDIGKTIRERLWCTILAIAGTVHFFCSAVAHSWFIGHTMSWTFLFLSLYLAIKNEEDRSKQDRNLFFAGLVFGLAVCCRLSNLLGAGVFAGFIIMKSKDREWIRKGIFFAIGAAIFGSVYMGLNLVRFGTIMDESYNLTHLKDYFKPLYYFMQEYFISSKDQMNFLHAVQKTDWDVAFPTFEDKRAFLVFLQNNIAESWNYCSNIPEVSIDLLSPAEIEDAFYSVVTSSFPKVEGALSTCHIVPNLRSIFLLLPDFQNEYPYVIPTMNGASISFCSPALFLFIVPLKTRMKEKMTWVLFGTMILSSLPFLLNYGNGCAQFGMRYAMDFIPYMLILACYGFTTGKWRSWKTALILFCVFINVWGPLYWRYFYLQ